MKYWFFAALFANFVLLLWEFHSGAFDSGKQQDGTQKQILLLSEAPQSESPAATNTAALFEAGQQPSAAPVVSDSVPSDTTIATPATTPSAAVETAPLLQADTAAVAVMPVTAAPQVDVATEFSVPVAPTTIEAVAQQTASTDAVVQMPATVVLPATLAVATAPKPDATTPAAPEGRQTSIPASNDAAQQDAAAASAASSVQSPESVQQPQPGTAAAAGDTAALPAETTTAAADQPPAPDKPEKIHQVCYSVTQVKNPSGLNALLDKYRPQLLALESISREARKNDSYLVYYPPQATLQESVAFAENLRGNYGIQDLLVFREGELKGAIALGVFSSEERAKIAQSQLEQKGLQTQIRPRYPLEVHYSLKMRWHDGQQNAAETFAKILKSRFGPVDRLPSCGG